MSQLIQGLDSKDVEIKLESHKNIRLMVVTWNMGNAKAEGLEHLLPVNGSGYDLIVLGLQESTYTVKDKDDKANQRRKSKVDLCVDLLMRQIEAVLGPEFIMVAHNKRAQMQQLIFARESLNKFITNVELSAENTGFLHVFPNKGGLCISFTVHGTSLVFISCHLTAHEGVKNCCLRNESTKEILGGVRSGDKRFDPAAKAHHAFWMGDMNYRITFDKRTPADIDAREVTESTTVQTKVLATNDENDGLEEDSAEEEDIKERDAHFKKVFELIDSEQWQALLAYDELTREMLSGRILNGFHDLQPSFPPTFKRKRHVSIRKASDLSASQTSKEYALSLMPNTDEHIVNYYDPKRIPSFTDRILFKSLPGFKENITAESFESCEDAVSSDHKPVRATFQIETTSGAKGIHVKHDASRGHSGSGFTLHISNLKGRNLAEMDSQFLGGGSDPYVIVLADPPQLLASDSKVKSEIIMHNLNPVWEGHKNVLKLKFKTDDYNGISDNAHIFFSVWDYDQITEDDLIGIFAISMKEIINHLRATPSFDFDQPLISNGEIMGDLSGTITCVDSNDNPCILPPEKPFSQQNNPVQPSFRLQRQQSVTNRVYTLADAPENPLEMASCCALS